MCLKWADFAEGAPADLSLHSAWWNQIAADFFHP